MIIAFSGKKGVGKTLAADYLVEHYGFSKGSFADLIRQRFIRDWQLLASEDLAEWVHGPRKEQIIPSLGFAYREYAKHYGGFMRGFARDYWITQIELSAKLTVIDDMRYKNEADYLKSKEAILIRINRYPKQNPYPADDHPSETDLDNYGEFNYLIHEFQNNNRYDLYSRLDDIMEDIMVNAKQELHKRKAA